VVVSEPVPPPVPPPLQADKAKGRMPKLNAKTPLQTTLDKSEGFIKCGSYFPILGKDVNSCRLLRIQFKNTGTLSSSF
jgi:hypothetical protein